MYLVMKEGVHLKEVKGIYSKFSDAKDRAQIAAEMDWDDWHTYRIYTAELDSPEDPKLVEDFVPVYHSLFCKENCPKGRHFKHLRAR